MSGSPPSSSWQDRRFMFPAGREVHQGSRGFSASKGSESDDSAISTSPTATATAPPPAPADTEPSLIGKVIPSWDGDRRFMFPAGKEVHQPARRASQSSGSGDAASPPPTTSPKAARSGSGSGGTSGIAAAIAGRRRSSAASSQGGGLFGGLMANRGSNEHDQRRQGWDDMKRSDGLGGFFSGLVNKPADKK